MFITHRTDKHTELDEIKMVTEGGCSWVQLRMKENPDLDDTDALHEAKLRLENSRAMDSQQ